MIIIAIPDIHGRLDKLDVLLNKIDKEYSNYKLIFLGDYVDRGPDSALVLRTIHELTKRGHVALMGNHEEFFLDWLHTGSKFYTKPFVGGQATLESFEKELNQKLSYDGMYHYLDRVGVLQWISNLPVFHTEGKLVFTHAPVSRWVDGRPANLAQAKHGTPPGMLQEDFQMALQCPEGHFAICGHIPCEDPLVLENGLYLDCGCGYENKSLRAAVFKDDKLIELLDSDENMDI